MPNPKPHTLKCPGCKRMIAHSTPIPGPCPHGCGARLLAKEKGYVTESEVPGKIDTRKAVTKEADREAEATGKRRKVKRDARLSRKRIPADSAAGADPGPGGKEVQPPGGCAADDTTKRKRGRRLLPFARARARRDNGA